MKISQRELILGWCTGLVLLVGITYWMIQPRLAAWREMRLYRQAITEQIKLAQRLVDQRPEWVERMDQLRTSVDRHPADRDVTADYLRLLERLAGESNLTLIKRNAQKEKAFGDLLELLIDCTWEGELEALVQFIYALEKQSAVMDMEELTVSLVSGKDAKLKGNFVIVCIYSRLPPDAAASQSAASGAPADTTPSPAAQLPTNPPAQPAETPAAAPAE